MFKPYLEDIINDLKKFERHKIQLAISINFISSKDDNDDDDDDDDDDEECKMHSKNDNIEIMMKQMKF